MATVGNMESTRAHAQLAGTVDLLIGIAGPVDAEGLRARAAQALPGLALDGASAGQPPRIAVASPANAGIEDAEASGASENAVRFLGYPLAASSTPVLPWLAAPAAYRAIGQLAESLQARSCVIVSHDLAALDRPVIEALARPLVTGAANLTMPVYPTGKYEGLLNSAILYPFMRALYGKQLRFPLALEFGVAGGMISRLAVDGGHGPAPTVFCAALQGALGNASMSEAHVDVHHVAQHEGIDLSTVLGALASGLFEDAERNAAYWQRVRGSQRCSILGTPAQGVEDGNGVDLRPLIESFQLGLRSLQEVWGLVLPPVTLLELRKMARLPAQDFHMPDALWAKIVYDFALAHRLRTISRTHLLGALTPLYLGWVASYAANVATEDSGAAWQRIERLAAAFEETKPYFVSRWRWPDRFNP